MIVEIINVGTELLLGEIVNTNATAILKMCKQLGFDVYHQSVVGDNPQRLLDCFDIAFTRGANCIITTGGLGPTQDDLTKEISAQYLGLEMEVNSIEVDKVLAKCGFLGGNKSISKANYKQGNFPKTAHILENDLGTANGCVLQNEKQMIINLPGPPKELDHVIQYSLLPYLSQFAKEVMYTYDFVTMGIGESRLEDTLHDLIKQQEEVSIALYAQESSVRIRLACKAISQIQADMKMEKSKEDITKCISHFILDTKQLPQRVQEMIPSFEIIYEDQFRMPDTFTLHNTCDEEVVLTLRFRQEQHPLGDIVYFTIEDATKQEVTRIANLISAQKSMNKIVAKVYMSLYLFIQNKENYGNKIV